MGSWVCALAFVASVMLALPSVAAEGGTTPSPRYRPAPVEDLFIPREAIIVSGNVLKSEGMRAFDEEALGNIPFYWVDQVFYSPDFNKSIVLKLKVELEDKSLEQSVISTGRGYAFHGRTQADVPYALYFVGYPNPSEVTRLSQAVHRALNRLDAQPSLPKSVSDRLSEFLIPSAGAQTHSPVNCDPTRKPVPHSLTSLSKTLSGPMFETMKGCLISAIRGVRNEVVGQANFYSGAVSSAASAIWDGSKKAVKSGWRFATGFFQDAWDNGVISATSKAMDQVSRKVTTTVEQAWNGVQHFAENASAFIQDVYSQVTSGLSGALALLKDNPQAATSLICGFISQLVTGIGVDAVITALTVGGGAAKLVASIGAKVARYALRLKKIEGVMTLLASAGKSGSNTLTSMMRSIDTVSEKTLSLFESMTGRHKLNRLATEAAACTFR